MKTNWSAATINYYQSVKKIILGVIKISCPSFVYYIFSIDKLCLVPHKSREMQVSWQLVSRMSFSREQSPLGGPC